MICIRSFTLGFVLLFFLSNYCIGESANTAYNDKSHTNKVETQTTTLKLLLKKARNYKKKRQFEKALNAYIKFYNESNNIHRFSGVRTSSVLKEIREIGDKYEPALKKLMQLRTLKRQKILSGHYTSKDCREVLAIDSVLEQNNKTVDLFDNIVKKFGKNKSLINDFTIAIWEELYKLKRYKDIEGSITALTRREVTLITDYMVEMDFPSNIFNDSAVYRQWMESKIVNDGRRIHEILTALGRYDESTKLEKWLLYFAGDKKEFNKIINASSDTMPFDSVDK
jgi:hypothetical protein